MHPATLRTLTGALFFALAAQAAWAETLSFNQCVELALNQNPDLAISRAQIEQAEAATRQAEGNWMPRLNLSVTATHTNDALNVFGMKLSQRNASLMTSERAIS
jgi:outer membrane protein TolC